MFMHCQNLKQFNNSYPNRHTIIGIILFITFTISFNISYAQNTIEIDSIFEEYTNTQPGIAVSVIKDGSIVYEKGFGMANIEYGVTIQETTKFHVASLSKQFTAFMILKLQDDGLLSIQDDIRTYIPEIPDYGKTITINHLLTHSSGLRDQWRLLEMAGWRLDDVIKTEQIFNLIKNQQALSFSPGEKFSYSNSGYTLLAIIIENITEMSFADYAKQTIFDPLNMNESFFYDDYEELVINRAYSYKKQHGELKKSHLNFATVGPTSLFTTINDMSKWAINFQEMTIGNEDIFESMNQRELKENGTISNYAKGQFVRDYKGLTMIYHSGSDAGYRCYFARIPDLGYQFILFANASYINASKETFKVIDYFLQNEFQESETIDSQDEIYTIDEEILVNLSNAEMKRFEGKYFDYETNGYVEIKIKNDSLYFSGGVLSGETKLLPVGKSNFKITGTVYDISVNFKENSYQEPILEFRIPDVMWIYYNKVKKVDISEYLGTYYSEELNTKYDLVQKDNELYLTHTRLDDIKVTQVNETYFSSNNRNFSEIRFKKNTLEEVIQFSVSNESVENMIFLKEH